MQNTLALRVNANADVKFYVVFYVYGTNANAV